MDVDSRRLLEALNELSDAEGIARYAPRDLVKRLVLEAERLEWCLEDLYVCGMIMYVTRRNEETGEELKIVQMRHAGEDEAGDGGP